MIKKRTVFILGAGASKPFGYPVGQALYNNITDFRAYDSVIGAYLDRSQTKGDVEWEKIKQLLLEIQRKMRLAPFGSIDTFLEKNLRYLKLGKILISTILIECEHPSNIYSSGRNWYSYLLNNLMLNHKNLMTRGKISFITFNYDRSLEHFVFNALKNGFAKSEEESVEAMSNIPIVHFYGSLGPLEWQSESGYAYSNSDNLNSRYRGSIDTINLVGTKKPLFEDAYLLLENAEQICFLGFGFNRVNLDRLGMGNMRNKTILASAYDFKRSERNAIKEYFGGNDMNITLGDEKADALEFLRVHVEREL